MDAGILEHEGAEFAGKDGTSSTIKQGPTEFITITSPQTSTKRLQARTRSQVLTSLAIHGACIIALLAFVSAVFLTPASGHMNVDCDPNGNIQVRNRNGNMYNTKSNSYDGPDTNSWWDPSLFLSITIGFGRLSFSAAKGIDICWDFLVGRVGQILLAVASYPILRRSLACAMERRPVHVKTYSSIAFSGVSLSSLWAVLLEAVRALRYGFRGFPWIILAQIIAIAYILGFATIVSVMTGYSTAFTPWVTRPDNQNRVAVSDLSRPSFVITDGSRVGLDDNHFVRGSVQDHMDLLTCMHWRARLNRVYARLTPVTRQQFFPRRARHSCLVRLRDAGSGTSVDSLQFVHKRFRSLQRFVPRRRFC